MHRVLVAGLTSAALFLGSAAFVMGGAGVANAAPRTAAGIPLTGLWAVEVPSLPCHPKICEKIKFDTSNKTFAEHDNGGHKDHGSYSLGHHVINLLWTGGTDRGVTFVGTFNGGKDEFVGTYSLGGMKEKGVLAALA